MVISGQGCPCSNRTRAATSKGVIRQLSAYLARKGGLYVILASYTIRMLHPSCRREMQHRHIVSRHINMHAVYLLSAVHADIEFGSFAGDTPRDHIETYSLGVSNVLCQLVLSSSRRMHIYRDNLHTSHTGSRCFCAYTNVIKSSCSSFFSSIFPYSPSLRAQERGSRHINV